MGYIPLFMTVTDQPCVVIGGNAAAEERARTLLEAGAIVTVISPSLTSELKELAERGVLQYRARALAEGDLSGFVLAYCADLDPAVGRRAVAEARALGIPINVTDRPEFCSFIAPAVVRRGPLQIAISTGGASPALAKILRQELEARIGPQYETLLTVLAAARCYLRRCEPDAERRAELSQALALALRETLMRDDYAGADAELRRHLGLGLADLGIDPSAPAARVRGPSRHSRFAMNPLGLAPALLCYLAATAGFILERAGMGLQWRRRATIELAAGAALQTAALATSGMRAGNIPVTDFAESICFLSLLTAIAGLILVIRFRIAVIGAFVAPLVLVATAVATATMRRQQLRIPHALRSAWLPVHVTLAFVGFALFLLAAGVSVVYLIYERRLKAKRPLAPSDEWAPSLEKLDRINYQLLIWGFLMLTLAIITGAIWADATWGHFWSWEPQEFWSFVIWLMYAGLLESRLTAGWRGRRVAALTIAVLTVLIGSFVGLSLLNPGKHGGSFG